MQAPKTKSLSRRKKELYQKSSQYRSALTSDIENMKVDVARWGRSILVIGGSLYVAYKVLKLFKGSAKEETIEETAQKVVVTKESSVIVAKIKEQIALFLLAIAVKKLKEFLNDTQNDEIPA